MVRGYDASNNLETRAALRMACIVLAGFISLAFAIELMACVPFAPDLLVAATCAVLGAKHGFPASWDTKLRFGVFWSAIVYLVAMPLFYVIPDVNHMAIIIKNMICGALGAGYAFLTFLLITDHVHGANRHELDYLMARSLCAIVCTVTAVAGMACVPHFALYAVWLGALSCYAVPRIRAAALAKWPFHEVKGAWTAAMVGGLASATMISLLTHTDGGCPTDNMSVLLAAFSVGVFIIGALNLFSPLAVKAYRSCRAQCAAEDALREAAPATPASTED